DSLSPENLVKWGSISPEMLERLKTLVRKRKNILVCGATSSGKTSILNVLSSFIDPADRILTIEDAAELQLRQPHLVPFETRRPDKDGKGEVTFRDLLHSALRLRPDRIILGEIRGGEALDLLQAMNTGHSGSMSTIHANNAHDSLLRLETCVMYAGFDLPLAAIRNQVVAALNYVVHTGRLEDGSRKVLGLSRVLPLDHGEYQLAEEWAWVRTGTDENGKFTGEFRCLENSNVSQ
ncbi:MAG: Flp pilus assembly complex ATPase component TadA, partial [Lentisphaeria bacterium]|nr:Flp pilus assembly complex ATPase component TadA [Lentisphaeria bacterium]